MSELFESFHFMRPVWLLPTLVSLLFVARRGRRADPAMAPQSAIAPHLAAALQLKPQPGHYLTPKRALLMMVLLTGVIAAGPSWRQQPSPLHDDSAPLVILLDVSASMDADDVAPSRLERGKQKIEDLLRLIPDKRVALTVFAGSAHIVLPLTGDHDILLHYLASISSDAMPRPGKFPEYALTAINRLLKQEQQPADVLLITDGVGADSGSLVNAWLRRNGHTLTIYGIGQTRANTGFDRQALLQFARQTGGKLIDNTVDTTDVVKMSKHLQRRYRAQQDSLLPWEDAGYWLVWPLLLVVASWFRRGFTYSWLLLIAMAPWQIPTAEAQHARDLGPIHADTGPAQEAPPSIAERLFDEFAGLWLTEDQYGRLLLQLGHYRKAAGTFADPMWRAIAAYYAEDFAKAATLFTGSEDPAAVFAAANARAHRRDYIGALAQYRQLLQQHPDHVAAAANARQVQALVDAINALSESQPDQPGTASEPLSAEDGAPADGDAREREQSERGWTAEALIASPALAEQWLRGIQQDPARFLRSKFASQLEERGVSE